MPGLTPRPLLLLLAASLGRVRGCDAPPTVDLGSPEAAAALVAGLRSWGVVYIAGHGLDWRLVRRAEQQTKRFFRRGAAQISQHTSFIENFRYLSINFCSQTSCSS